MARLIKFQLTFKFQKLQRNRGIAQLQINRQMDSVKDQPLKAKQSMKKDFVQFFIQERGESVAGQSQFQQIGMKYQQSQKRLKEQSSDSEDEFKVQSDQEEVITIKNQKFWGHVKAPTNYSKVSNAAVQWEINCRVSFGFNSLGRDNIILIDKLICKAAGCVLVFNCKIYQKHSHKITTLGFSKSLGQLLSATQSSSPKFTEVFLWKYNPQEKSLQFLKRLCISGKSQDIYAVSFFRSGYLVAVEKFTLHKASYLHLFNKNSEKKMAPTKVGNFYDMQLLQSQGEDGAQNQRLFIANNQGISELLLKDCEEKAQIKVQSLVQDKCITCLCPFYSDPDNRQLQIIYGDKEGNLHMAFAKSSLKVHKGWIFQIKTKKYSNLNYFFALGAEDTQLSIMKYEGDKITIHNKISLGSYGRCIQIENDDLLIGNRNGNFQQFIVSELLSQDQNHKVTSNQTPSLRCFEMRDKQKARQKTKQKQFLISCKEYRKSDSHDSQPRGGKQDDKSYVYTKQNSKIITFFKLGKSLKDLSEYELRYDLKTFDIHQNIIAYTYDIEKKQQQEKFYQSFPSNISKGKSPTRKSFNKSVLIVQDYTKKQLLHRFSVKLGQQPNDKNCQKQKVCCVKISPSGKYLAIGNVSGNIGVLQINDQTSQKQPFIIKCQASQNKHMHTQAIMQLIWSQNQRYLKTTTLGQLLHWKVVEQQTQGIKPTQTQLQYSKADQIKQVRWESLARFGWQTKDIWNSMGHVGQIYKFWQFQHVKTSMKSSSLSKQIQTVKNKIIFCVFSDGTLKIYNHPAKNNIFQSIKLSESNFQICQFKHQNDKFSFWILLEGILLLIQLEK